MIGSIGYVFPMIDLERVAQVSTDVAQANLGPKNVLRVVAEPTTDLDGNEALHLLIVIAPGVAETASDDAVVDTLVQIIDRLRDAGEERFPIIEYATEEELADIDSP
jgi:hypothetical protein